MGQLSSSAVDFEKIMSSSSAPVQAPLPRRASAETLVGLRCAMVSETNASFACPICSRVLRQPQLTDCCGNHFCTACLSRWLQMSSSCPLCRQVGFKSIRDKKIQRTVQDMEVCMCVLCVDYEIFRRASTCMHESRNPCFLFYAQPHTNTH